MGLGNKSLFVKSVSHDQGGHHASIWYKPLKNLLLQNCKAGDIETWDVASGTRAHHSLFKW